MKIVKCVSTCASLVYSDLVVPGYLGTLLYSRNTKQYTLLEMGAFSFFKFVRSSFANDLFRSLFFNRSFSH